MAMIRNFIIKNWKILFNIQWMSFCIFIALTSIYYWDKAAHSSFNKNPETIDIQSLFSLFMTGLFALFTVIILIYPLLLLIQAYSIRHEKDIRKKLFFLTVLYLLGIISLFSLYTINSSHSIKALQSLN